MSPPEKEGQNWGGENWGTGCWKQNCSWGGKRSLCPGTEGRQGPGAGEVYELEVQKLHEQHPEFRLIMVHWPSAPVCVCVSVRVYACARVCLGPGMRVHVCRKGEERKEITLQEQT